MKQGIFTIEKNEQIAENVMLMELCGDTLEITKPGTFVNIKLEGFYLRRPISVCDVTHGKLTIIYKVVGSGTALMQNMVKGDSLDILSGLGNGYDISSSGENNLLIGGGVGVPPLYYLAKSLLKSGKSVTAILGFNKKSEIFFEDEFNKLGAKTIVTTFDGSYGLKGFVTEAMGKVKYDYFYACGPEPMLKAVYFASSSSGELSFERRMGCGFGACMGCSCKTITGYKRICKEGPVMKKEDIIWED